MMQCERLADDVFHEGGEGAEAGVNAVEEAAEDHDGGGGSHHAVLGSHGHRGPIAQPRSVPCHQPCHCTTDISSPRSWNGRITRDTQRQQCRLQSCYEWRYAAEHLL